MKEKKNTGKQDLNNIQGLQAKIKDLEWKIKEIDRSRWIWFNKCHEYEKLLFENKIPYDDLPF